jgi:hypothetical protein
MEKEIKKAIRSFERETGDKIKYPLDDIDYIEQISSHIEQRMPETYFGLYVRGSSGGDDFWLQCEYYSKKLQQTIIWSYDFTDSYESEEDLIEVLTCTERDLKAFERRLSVKK